MFLTIMWVLALPFSEMGSTGPALSAEVPDVEIAEHLQGLFSVSVPGFNSSTETGVMFPERTVMIPVPVHGDVTVEVVPSGIRSLGVPPPVAMSDFVDGTEVFTEAPPSALPALWGEVVRRGTWRRAGFVQVRLNPVILSGGELLLASNLDVRIDGMDSPAPRAVGGFEGDLFREVFGTDRVWVEAPSRSGESPFWGKPWARIQVDTAGVYRITGDMIPEAVGMPSSSFSMITGRGRMMSFFEPHPDAFVPRPVPILVEDGGDGVFDQSDHILFYGRGLSWWGEYRGDHFNSRFDDLNTYWLTWGGAGGPFMDVLDGSVTGAPSAGSSYENRLHYEENNTLVSVFGMFPDFYGWHRLSASGSTTANYSFKTPGTDGTGTLRVNMYVESGADLRVSASVNGSFMADTTRVGTGAFQWEFPVSGLLASNNNLALSIQNTGQSRSPFVIYTNWIEAFPSTGFKSWSSMCQVPLGSSIQPGERRLVTWAQSLGGDAFVCMTNSDTEVAAVDIPVGKDFEIEIPAGWRNTVMWVVPGGDFLEPVSVSPASPGRIVATLSSARTVYLYPEQFAPDMPLFQRGRPDVEMICLTEVYDEFNGGVRDPGAVRAFFEHTLRTWSSPPSQLVIVGNGHWDPRGFTTAKPSHTDVHVYGYYKGTPVVSDYLYSSPSSTGLPQAAVSRIAVDNRTELQLVAQRSQAYASIGSHSGTWQSVILGAADDERTPKNPQGDEAYHTRDTETIMTESVPDRFIPLRHYLIFWDWNSNWKKPESRTAYIERWSEGALISFFLGHGSFDQLADEGLLYIEDMSALAAGPRLPWAFFGSCDVGFFQSPTISCIAQKVTVTPGGGAIVSTAASSVSSGSVNARLLTQVMEYLFGDGDYTMGEAQWLGMLANGQHSNDRKYIVFGDGSLHLAVPGRSITYQEPDLYTAQMCSVEGSLEESGLVMLTAWESARRQTYYTRNQGHPIHYFSTPGVFYRGLAQASPEFFSEVFVPEVAVTGEMGRIRYFSPDGSGGQLQCAYPLEIDYGQGSPSDTAGPDIEMWLSGFRGIDLPSVSGSVVFEAELYDESGINLLPYPGNQLALYINDAPFDVSEYFTYQPGSATTGNLVYPLPGLQPGTHHLRLRAADNLTNISNAEMSFELVDSSSPLLTDFFVYPTPASTVMSFNWVQSMPGPVSISIYTVSGRRVAFMGNLQGVSGYNQHNWNLLDGDGDPVASGTYVYLLVSGDTDLSGVAAVVR